MYINIATLGPNSLSSRLHTPHTNCNICFRSVWRRCRLEVTTARIRRPGDMISPYGRQCN